MYTFFLWNICLVVLIAHFTTSLVSTSLKYMFKYKRAFSVKISHPAWAAIVWCLQYESKFYNAILSWCCFGMQGHIYNTVICLSEVTVVLQNHFFFAPPLCFVSFLFCSIIFIFYGISKFVFCVHLNPRSVALVRLTGKNKCRPKMAKSYKQRM